MRLLFPKREQAPAPAPLDEPPWRAPAPRDTRWTVVRGSRIEIRDAGGELIAWTKRLPSTSLRAADGSVLTSTKQTMKLDATDLVTDVISGTAGGPDIRGTSPRAQPDPTRMPPLAIRDGRSRATVAHVQGDQTGATVVLLPDARGNRALLEGAMPAERIARYRSGSPLRYERGGLALLGGGAVVARWEGARTIAVLDNTLPAIWLLGILLACAATQTGTAGR